jgi:predicted component of type VI protein secretion system
MHTSVFIPGLMASHATDNNIGAGTVTSIVNYYKIGLEDLDFDSIRELALEIRKQGLDWSDLGSYLRLNNYLKKSGAAEDKVESFITIASSSDFPPEKVVEYVNQLYDVSKSESLPLDQVSGYIKEKLEEKRNIDEEIKQADAILQSKNVSIEVINQHIQLNEKLNEHGLSMHNIDELLNLVLNAKRYGFEPKKIVGKLRTIQRLEKKEKGLEHNCTILSNLLDKHKETIPLAELIETMCIGKNELISYKIAVNEVVQMYGLTPSAAALHVINLVKDYNTRGQLKHELAELSFQKYAINEFCSNRSQVIMTLLNLQSHGITEDRILYLNDFMEKDGYNIDSISKHTKSLTEGVT